MRIEQLPVKAVSTAMAGLVTPKGFYPGHLCPSCCTEWRDTGLSLYLHPSGACSSCGKLYKSDAVSRMRERKRHRFSIPGRFGPCVYAIATRCAHIKIGVASNLKSRMSSLAGSMPTPDISIFAAREFASPETCTRVERALQYKLLSSGHHWNGEWFRLSFESACAIRSLLGDQCRFSCSFFDGEIPL